MPGKRPSTSPLSNRAAALLRGEETLTAEFKRSAAEVSAEDFVQFANSTSGGDLLVGVEEVKASDGKRLPRPCGCPINDDTKRKLLDKALSCSPPIEPTIFVETANGHSFYRLQIASGSHKPYCTASGNYRIRADGRVKALLPAQLLDLFLESHGATFVERFKAATTLLDQQLDTLNEKIADLTASTSDRLSELFSTADNAESLADESMNSAMEAAEGVNELGRLLDDVPQRVYQTSVQVRAILNHLGLEDPIEAEQRRFTESLMRHWDQRVKADSINSPAQPTRKKRISK